MRLVETRVIKGLIVESDRVKLPKGVLCRVTYPICNIDELNANKRMYEAAVWEKVMSNKDIVEKLQRRALFGHAEHPQETQSNLERVSHVIFEMWSDDKQVFQKIDILDTPTGRIVNTILEANCQVGVSTRAEGDLEEKEDDTLGKYHRVIPESYNYVTTDFTADPSTFDALPQDVKKNIVSAIGREFKNESANKSEKEFAKQLLESMKCKKDKCVNCGCCKVLGEEKKVQCESCKKLITQNEYADGQGLCPECIKSAKESKMKENIGRERYSVRKNPTKGWDIIDNENHNQTVETWAEEDNARGNATSMNEREKKTNVKENSTCVTVSPEKKEVVVGGAVNTVTVKPEGDNQDIKVVVQTTLPPVVPEPVVVVTPSAQAEPVAKEVSPEVEKELEKEVGLEKGEKEEEEKTEESKIPKSNDSLVDEVVAGNILKDNKNVYFKVKSIDVLGIALQPVEEGVEVIKFIEWDKVGGLGLIKVAETKIKEQMSEEEAIDILGDRATWELRNMKKALGMLSILNTPEDEKRLEAVKVLLQKRSKKEESKIDETEDTVDDYTEQIAEVIGDCAEHGISPWSQVQTIIKDTLAAKFTKEQIAKSLETMIKNSENWTVEDIKHLQKMLGVKLNVLESKVNETADIIAMYKAAGLPAPDGKGEHTKAFHELAIEVAKGYVKSGDTPKEALDKAYPTAMKQLGRDKAVKKEHQRSEAKVVEKEKLELHDVVTLKNFTAFKLFKKDAKDLTPEENNEVLDYIKDYLETNESKVKEESKSVSTTAKQITDLRIKEAIVRAERDKLVEYVNTLKDNDLEVKILLKKIRESKAIDSDEVKALCSKVEEKAKTAAELGVEADVLSKEINTQKEELKKLEVSLEDMKKKHKEALDKWDREHKEQLENIQKDNEKKITEAIDKSKDETIKAVVKEYVDMKLRDGLTVHDNVRALLENCTTLTEVNEALEKVRDANRWSTLHSQPLKEVVVNKPVDPEQVSVSKRVGIVFNGFSNKG